MGCSSSSVQNEMELGINMKINILDSNFMKNPNDQTREKMTNHQIVFQAYLLVEALIEDMKETYTNQIITTEDKLVILVQELKNLNFSPNIYVLSSPTSELKNKFQAEKCISFHLSYDQIMEMMRQKNQKTRRISNSPQFSINRLQKVDLKIFQNLDDQSSEMLIFQQTLKSKSINYKKYHTFNELKQSMLTVYSKFIVTDYVYHREVINLTQIYKTSDNYIPNSKVICYCEGKQEENFDYKLYYVTNNFLQIVKEVQSEDKLKNLIPVKCSKVFMYADSNSYLLEYISLIQSQNLQVFRSSTLEKIVRQSRYYFALTIIINPEERKQVQTYLQKNDYLFKTKVVQIKKRTMNNFMGLRKALKQCKKGYKTQKSLTRSVDIIDKYFNDTKFDVIKKILQNNSIKVYGYENVSSYIKNTKFISPYIITNFQERSLVVRYLNEVQFKSKIIIFCNKNFISESIKNNINFAFASHHFGQILQFIRKKYVYNPCIMDDNDHKIKQKKQNLKIKNKRISALNWCIKSGKLISEAEDIIALENKFQFLNITSQINQSNVRDIQKQSAGLFKLNYTPATNKTKFIKNLIQSLRKLKILFKINFPENEFQKLLEQIQQSDIESLLKKIRELFSSQNQLGVKMNKYLINLSALSKQQIQSMKELLFLINMNYLPLHNMKSIHRVNLYHYIQSDLIDRCEIGSYLLNKNYSVFYQKQDICQSVDSISAEDKIAKYRIDLQFEYNTLGDYELDIDPFFTSNHKYIFQPFSQFLIKQISKINDITVVTVQYKRNIDYLKAYLEDNLVKTNVLDYYQTEIKKCQMKNQHDFLLVDNKNIEHVNSNIYRLDTLKLFKASQFDQAIKRQKQIIKKEQNLQNFDSCKLESLNYELACFYFKSGHEQCQQLLKQLLDSSPTVFLKQKLKIMWNYYQKQSNMDKQNDIENPNLKNEQIMKIINLGEQMINDNSTEQLQKSSQIEEPEQQIDNIFQMINIQNEFPYIEIEDIKDFEENNKENIEKQNLRR